MKEKIHPKYQDIKFICACGAEFIAGSTLKEDFKTELCSNCHPFFTGKQKLVDTSGRVDKFQAKRKKAQELAEKKVKKISGDELEEELKDIEEVRKLQTKIEKAEVSETAEAKQESGETEEKKPAKVKKTAGTKKKTSKKTEE